MRPPCEAALETERWKTSATQLCSAMPQAEALLREPHRHDCNMLRYKPAFPWGAALCSGALQPGWVRVALAGTAAVIAWPSHAQWLLEPTSSHHTNPSKSCLPEAALTSRCTPRGTVIFNKGFYNINIDFDTVKTYSFLIPTNPLERSQEQRKKLCRKVAVSLFHNVNPSFIRKLSARLHLAILTGSCHFAGQQLQPTMLSYLWPKTTWNTCIITTAHTTHISSATHGQDEAHWYIQ